MLLYAADRKKINRAARLRCHSRDVGRAVVRVYPDNEFGWRAQVITAPTSVELADRGRTHGKRPACTV